MKGELRQFFDKQKKIFEEHLGLVKKSDNAELIHQLRLSVKRIRALFTFLQFLTGKPSKGKKDIKALKVVYKPAGRIRDVQVHLGLLDSYEKRLQFEFTDYRSYLGMLEKQHHKDLKQSMKGFSAKPFEKLHTKTYKIIDQFSDEEIIKNAGKMLDEKFELISNLNKIPTDKEKNLHEIRRILKEIRYLLNIFNGNIPESKRLKVSLSRLKQIEQTLGKWHDQVNAMLFVKAYLNSKQIEDKAQKEKYKLLLKAIRRYKSSLLKRTQHAFKYELEV
ncbi:MAG: CHAD domain-containing protein [Bacteroidales bacterium]|nr:CHAD domain-containing protein [Bacteroidales bacterium]MCF8351491.1 CHAD domain-containing protein [Bacteroidales bacterium]MCF8374716.1 CHAD domain-containing protein [Bacteroidales bacterium]